MPMSDRSARKGASARALGAHVGPQLRPTSQRSQAMFAGAGDELVGLREPLLEVVCRDAEVPSLGCQQV